MSMKQGKPGKRKEPEKTAKALMVFFFSLIETDAKKYRLAQNFAITKIHQLFANHYETWLK